MPCRGVRGATTADSNSREDILNATRQLLALMIRRNTMETPDVASAVFSSTHDLNAEFPALAARQLGWIEVPLLCTHEMDVPGSLGHCIRILVHWNTPKHQHEIHHIYVKGATQLRPDIRNVEPADWDELDRWIQQQMGSSSS